MFTLLGMQTDVSSKVMAPTPDEAPGLATSHEAETAALEPMEQTMMTPQLVEDLQGLSGSQNDRTNYFEASPAVPSGLIDYRSRWLQRWKWSMLVAAWAVTTIFAFTANVAAFGPSEWFVAIFASVVGGGLLVGTLLNFAVAAMPTRAPAPTSTDGR